MERGNGAEKNTFVTAVKYVFAAVLAAFLYIVVLSLVSAAFYFAAEARGLGTTTEEIAKSIEPYSTLAALIGNIIAAALLVLILVLKKKNVPTTLKVARISLLTAVCCVALGAAFNFFVDSAITLAPFPKSVTDYYEELYSFIGKGSAAVEIVGVVIVTPVVEEAVFRGVAHRFIRMKTGVAAAVIISSLIFGAAHANLLSFVFTSLLGVLLAIAYEKTESLVAPVLIHVAFNGASYAADALFKDPSTGTLAAVSAVSFVLCAAAFAAILHKKKSLPPEKKAEIGEIK